MFDTSNFGISDALMVSFSGICVVMLELGLIAVIILMVSKFIRLFEGWSKRKPVPVGDAPSSSTRAMPVPSATSGDSVQPSKNLDLGDPLPETESEGTLDLYNVDEPTAAVIMAIISNQSGIPLNRLSFKSIKLLEDY